MTELLMAAPGSAGDGATEGAATAAGPRTPAADDAEDPVTSASLQACKDVTAGVFDRAAATYDGQGPRVFTHCGRRLVARAGVPHGATVLDVGTDRGAVLVPAAQQVGPRGSAIGVDRSPEMVRLTRADLRRAGIAHATVHRMDAEQLQFPAGSFERVLCGCTLFLLPRPARALAECRRVLKPGGRLAVTTWGAGDGRWSWSDELLRRVPSAIRPAPPTLQHPAGLAAIIRAAGFVGVRVAQETLTVVYPSEAEWWAALWSRGERGVLEGMQPEVCDAFRTAAFERLQPLRRADGFHRRVRVLVATAGLPAGEETMAGRPARRGDHGAAIGDGAAAEELLPTKLGAGICWRRAWWCTEPGTAAGGAGAPSPLVELWHVILVERQAFAPYAEVRDEHEDDRCAGRARPAGADGFRGTSARSRAADAGRGRRRPRPDQSRRAAGGRRGPPRHRLTGATAPLPATAATTVDQMIGHPAAALRLMHYPAGRKAR